MAGSNNTTSLFLFFIFFWGIISFVSSYLGVQITKSSLADYRSDNQPDASFYQKFMTGTFNFLDNIPVVNYFVPLFKIMTFNYGNEIPKLLSILIDALAIISAYVVWHLK